MENENLIGKFCVVEIPDLSDIPQQKNLYKNPEIEKKIKERIQNPKLYYGKIIDILKNNGILVLTEESFLDPKIFESHNKAIFNIKDILL